MERQRATHGIAGVGILAHPQDLYRIHSSRFNVRAAMHDAKATVAHLFMEKVAAADLVNKLERSVVLVHGCFLAQRL